MARPDFSTAIVLSCAVAIGCGEPAPRFSPLHSQHGRLYDERGRVVVLRGVNARVRGVFDVALDSGRQEVEPIPEFGEADATRMRELGFNFLRLPVNWSGLEPARGVYSSAYLDRIARVVDLCRAQDIWVLIDLHQDAWSKEIGEDGAPLWAIVPPPTMLLEGPLDDLEARRVSEQVQRASTSFFTENAMGLQEDFARMAARLAARFKGDRAVIGYEIFNEPVATDEELRPFHEKVARAIRAADPDHLIAFEPSVTRNFTNAAPIASAPFPIAGTLYAPHVYTGQIGNDRRIETDNYQEALAASIRGADEEANSWGASLLIGEFGAGDWERGYEYLGHAYDTLDEILAGGALWLWKEESQGFWGLYDKLADGSWQERPGMVGAVSRPYARAIAGAAQSMRWDGTRLTVKTRGGGEHEIFFPGATSARCDGKATAVTGQGVITVSCEGETIEVE